MASPTDLPTAPHADPTRREMPDELNPRHLTVRVLEIAAIIGVGAIALTALPGLDEVKTRLTGADPVWIVALVLAELGSCAGYLLVFRSESQL